MIRFHPLIAQRGRAATLRPGPALFSAICLLLCAMAPRSAPAQPVALVKDISPGSGSSNPTWLASINDRLIFAATEATRGTELWISDGTQAGTAPLKDIYPGTKSSSPAGVTAGFKLFNGALYFDANDGSHGLELWKTDGTPGGTALLKDIYTGGLRSDPNGLTVGDGTLFFSARDAQHGQEMWKTDGTPGGTALIKDVYAGPNPTSFVRMDSAFLNGKAFFAADDGTNHGRELWRSDGTAPGTSLLKDIAPDSPSSVPQNFYTVGGKVLFTAYDAEHGRELWGTDGTISGTGLVRDINPPKDDSFLQGFCACNGQLFFQAYDGYTGRELWKSDGTTAGTVLVKDIWSAGSSTPTGLFDYNGTLFFSAQDGVHGFELWRSDGTAAGTYMVKDIYPGAKSSNPRAFANIRGLLFFSADDGVHGRELWMTDGSAAGTFLIKDISPGTSSSDPREMTEANNRILFSAQAAATGRELWALDSTQPGAPLLKSVEDIGEARIRATWLHLYQPPAQFLGAIWDLYLGQWVMWNPLGGFFHPLGAGSPGEMTVGNTGAYYTWVLAHYPDGTLLGSSPWTGVVYSGPPHTPWGFGAFNIAPPKTVRLVWQEEIYGTKQYQIIAYQVGTGFVPTWGLDGQQLWHLISYPSAQFLTGTVDLTVPASGDYWFFLRAVAWPPPYLGSDYAIAYISVP